MCTYWNRVSFKKLSDKKQKKIDSIGIGLASPEEIRRWGERELPNGTLIGKVDKDHTVDYESLKPIEGGLFCERIFGPMEDFYCSCERRGEKNEKFCPTCEVEFTRSQVRRTRMGYIPLAVPVAHVWYLRGRPSYIANLIGKTRNTVDKLAYGETLCESFIDATYQGSLTPNFSQQGTQHLMEFHECNVLNFDISNKEKPQLCNLVTPLTFFTSQGYKKTKRHFIPFTPQAPKRSQVDKGATKIALVKKKSSKLGSIDLDFADNVFVPLGLNRVQGTTEGCSVRQLTSYPSSALLTIQQVKTFQSGPLTSLAKLDKSKGVQPAYPKGVYAWQDKVQGAVAPYKTLEKLYFASLVTPDNLKIFVVRNLYTWQFFYVQLLQKALTPLILKGATYFSHQPKDFSEKKSFTNFIPIFKRLRLIPQRGKASKNFELCYPVNCFLRKDNWPFSEKVLANTDKEITRKLPVQVRHQLSTVNVNQYTGEFEKNKNVSIDQTDTLISKDGVMLRVAPGGQKKRDPSDAPSRQREASSNLIIPNPATASLTPSGCEASSESKEANGLGAQEAADNNQSFLGKYTKFHTLPIFSTFIYKEWSHRFSFLEYFIWSARENDLALPFYTHKSTCHKMRKNSVNWIKNRLVSSFIPQEYKESQLAKPMTPPLWGRSGVQIKNKTTVVAPVYPEGVPAFFNESQLALTPNPINLVTGLGLAKLMGYQETLQNKTSTETPLIETVMNSLPFLLKNEIPHFLQLRNRKTTLVCGVASNNILERCSIITYVEQDLTFEQDRLSLFRQRKNIFIWESTAYAERVDAVPRLPEQLTVTPSLTQHPFGIKSLQSKSKAKETEESRLFSAASDQLLEVGRVRSEQKYPLNPKGLRVRKLLGKDLLPLRGKGYVPLLPLRGNAKYQQGAIKDCSVNGDTVLGALKSSIMAQESNAWRNAPYNGQSDQVLFSNPFGVRGEVEDTQQFPRLAELLHFTGGTALRHLLGRFDLALLSKFLRYELKNLELKVNLLLALKILTYSQGLLLGKLAKRRSKQIRRLKLLELFQSQKSNPKWMILSVLPVLPPDLRPILRVNDDFVVASDLNRLYQTVLRRNNTIHERLDDPLPCPESGLFRQRSLQKAVDGLLENGKGGGTPLCASKRRPLVSLSHVLKGKKGLFRQHLLGKRVDYSGRSVIVVGPKLNLHECGLPKEMALELFQPFLIHRLKIKGLAISNTAARRMIQQEDPAIWHIIKQLVYEHPVLLNRAPTLHRLGIQAFQPRLVSGRAILLHPLVCNGFNADFDGDQMAVHVPLSFQARAEAWKIMWSKNNLLSPATGQPILVPSQDMVLGCYYLSVFLPRVVEYKKSFNFSEITSLSPVSSVKDQSQTFKTKGNKVQTKKSLDAPLYKLALNLISPRRGTDNPAASFLPFTPNGVQPPVYTPQAAWQDKVQGAVAPYKPSVVPISRRLTPNLSASFKGIFLRKPEEVRLAEGGKNLGLYPERIEGHGLGYSNKVLNPFLFVTPFGFFKKTQHLGLLSDTTSLKNMAAVHKFKASNNALKKNFFYLSTQLKGNAPMTFPWYDLLPLPLRLLPKTNLGCTSFYEKTIRLERSSRCNSRLLRRRVQSVIKGYSVLASSVGRTPYRLTGDLRSSERLVWYPMTPKGLLPERVQGAYTPFGCSGRENYSVKPKKAEGVNTFAFYRCETSSRFSYPFSYPEGVDALQEKERAPFQPAAFFLPKIWSKHRRIFKTFTLSFKGSSVQRFFSFGVEMYYTKLKKEEKLILVTPFKLARVSALLRHGYQDVFFNNVLAIKTSFDNTKKVHIRERVFDSTNLINNSFSAAFFLSLQGIENQLAPTPSRSNVYDKEMLNNCRKTFSESFGFVISQGVQPTVYTPTAAWQDKVQGTTEGLYPFGVKGINFQFSPLSLYDFYICSRFRTPLANNMGISCSLKLLESLDALIFHSVASQNTPNLSGYRVVESDHIGNFKKGANAFTLALNRILFLPLTLGPGKNLISTGSKKVTNEQWHPSTEKTNFAHQLERGHYFSSLQDSLIAYSQGRLQTHTPFWVRVNSLIINGKNEQGSLVYPEKLKKELQLINAEKPLHTKGLVDFSLTPPATSFDSLDPAGVRLDKKQQLKETIKLPFRDIHFDTTNLAPIARFLPRQLRKPEGVRGITKENVKTSRDFFFGHAYTNVTKISYGKTKSARNDKDFSRPPYGKESLVACRRLTKLPKASQVLTNSSEFALFQLRYGFSKELCKLLFKKNHYKTIIETNDVVEVPLELRISADRNLIKVLTTFQNHYNCDATVLDQCQENCIKYMRTTAGRVVINEALFHTS